MSQSLSLLYIHLIFSTKNRHPALAADIRPNLNAYIAGIPTQWDSSAIAIECVEDHIHLLFRMSKKFALSKIVEEVKKGSSKWLKTQGESLATFYWQAGYGAFSVSQSAVPEVKKYIQRQEEHHRKITFQDEFRLFLKKHQIDFDEKWVWD